MSARDLVAAQSDALVPAGFQRDIMANMADALLRQPSPPCLLRAPTGSGKTFMLAGVLDRVSAATPTLWLWFVPFVNLVQQTEDALLANAPALVPVALARGRNQEPAAGMVLLSTAQAVARAKDRKAGYAGDGDDDRKTLNEFVALARARGLKIGLVVDEAHIGLDHGTEFGQFAQWLDPHFLLMASATPKDARLDEFLEKANKGAREAFVVSRAQVVEARLNKRYIEAVVYDLRRSVSTVADLKRTVLRQAWLRHLWLKQRLQEAGVALTPLLLVQVGNGDKTVEEAERELVRLCKVPPGAIGKHSASDPDPVLMAAIANDHSKEVLIFKQSAGTGFDAPRAFVLASTKPVNEPDFAMQFIGRVMRVAPAIRATFPKPMPIPAELDTAYVYLADAEAQQGFQSAVNTSAAVQSQLEGQTERMVVRHTESGATVYTTHVTPQMPMSYDQAPPEPGLVDSSKNLHDKPSAPGPQGGLFGPESGGAGAPEAHSALMSWDPVRRDETLPRAPDLPVDEAALMQRLSAQGLKAYPRRVTLQAAPPCLKQETRPVLADMARVSREAAAALPVDETLAAAAVAAAYNLLHEKETHTELTSGARHQEDVVIVTDRGALLREAETCLRRVPQVEDADVRIIVDTIAQRLLARVAAQPVDQDAVRDEKQLARLARDAACWVIRKEVQAFSELMLETIARFATVEDAQPLPDVMLYPLQHALRPSEKNLYGVLPPDKATFEAEREGLDIDALTTFAQPLLAHAGGKLRSAGYDGTSALNAEELAFARALDADDSVVWWHRNPDRKPWSVRLVRSEHTNYFYPDFVVCLTYPQATDKLPHARLIETKENVKDAARKAKHVPNFYGKVLFLTKDQKRLKWVKEDGSLGDDVDLDDLSEIREWLRKTRPV
jgi:hypothetical protein